MKKSKKGFTLIEVIAGLLILGFAIVVGAQTFAAVGTGYTRATRLDHGADYIFNAFENGTPVADLPDGMTKNARVADVKVSVNGVHFTETVSLTEIVYSYEKGSVSARLYGMGNTYGTSK